MYVDEKSFLVVKLRYRSVSTPCDIVKWKW